MNDSTSIWDWIWLVFPFLNALFLIAMIRQVIWGWLIKLVAFVLPFLLYNDNWTFSNWSVNFFLTQSLLLGLSIWGYTEWKKQGIDGRGIDLGFSKQHDDLLDNLAIEEDIVSQEKTFIRQMPREDQVLLFTGIAAVSLVLIVLNAYTGSGYNAIFNISTAFELGFLYLLGKRNAEAWIAGIAALVLELYRYHYDMNILVSIYGASVVLTLALAIYGLIIWWQVAQKRSL